MSTSKPAVVSAFWRAGRSRVSHRGEDAASGRITHARLLAAGVAEQPARRRAETAATAATEIIEDVFMSPFHW
jgi:hypothetical protein